MTKSCFRPNSATYWMCDLGRITFSVPHYLHLKMGRTPAYRVGIRIRQCIYKVFTTMLAYTTNSKFLFFSHLPPSSGG